MEHREKAFVDLSEINMSLEDLTSALISIVETIRRDYPAEVAKQADKQIVQQIINLIKRDCGIADFSIVALYVCLTGVVTAIGSSETITFDEYNIGKMVDDATKNPPKD